MSEDRTADSDTGLQHQTRETVGCPFEDCDWTTELPTENGRVIDDSECIIHYEREHAGRVRLQITIEKELLIGDRDLETIRESELKRWEEDGHDVAHVRSEVLQETDEHPEEVSYVR
jgi:hypothetical protein